MTWHRRSATPAFSPHAWGCTFLPDAVARGELVFPTRVGVYRITASEHTVIQRFPHTRGGVPAHGEKLEQLQAFSPHAWGCTAVLVGDALGDVVFPTRVGVYR